MLTEKSPRTSSGAYRARWLLVLLGTACRTAAVEQEPIVAPATTQTKSLSPALPLERIAIVGASVSAGFGGMPFGDAFAKAAPRSQIDAWIIGVVDPIADARPILVDSFTWDPGGQRPD